jgi:SAM-dependent methyltransferase
MKAFIKKLIPFQIGSALKKTKQSIQSLFLKGNQYECPFCKGKYRKFLPGGENHLFFKYNTIIGGGRRPNMLCPRCYSTDRDRLIYYYLTSNNLINANPYSLLHIAPEPSLKKFLKNLPNIKYTSGDKFEKGYNGFFYDKETILLDLTSLPFMDNSFDILICNHVLEHIVDEKKAFSEIHRVLKPKGWAILQVPIAIELKQTLENSEDSDEKRTSLFGQHDHVRLYGLDYSTRLTSLGFNVEEWSPATHLEQKQISRYAINALESVFIAFKNANN